MPIIALMSSCASWASCNAPAGIPANAVRLGMGDPCAAFQVRYSWFRVFAVPHFSNWSSSVGSAFSSISQGDFGARATSSVVADRQKFIMACGSLASRIIDRKCRLPSTMTSSPQTGQIGMVLPGHSISSSTSSPDSSSRRTLGRSLRRRRTSSKPKAITALTTSSSRACSSIPAEAGSCAMMARATLGNSSSGIT